MSVAASMTNPANGNSTPRTRAPPTTALGISLITPAPSPISYRSHQKAPRGVRARWLLFSLRVGSNSGAVRNATAHSSNVRDGAALILVSATGIRSKVREQAQSQEQPLTPSRSRRFGRRRWSSRSGLLAPLRSYSMTCLRAQCGSAAIPRARYASALPQPNESNRDSSCPVEFQDSLTGIPGVKRMARFCRLH